MCIGCDFVVFRIGRGSQQRSGLMERNGDEVRLSTEEASGGAKPGVVRYMLAVGLLLAIAALSAIWITGALTN
jgi:hypothetical protein